MTDQVIPDSVATACDGEQEKRPQSQRLAGVLYFAVTATLTGLAAWLIGL